MKTSDVKSAALTSKIVLSKESDHGELSDHISEIILFLEVVSDSFWNLREPHREDLEAMIENLQLKGMNLWFEVWFQPV